MLVAATMAGVTLTALAATTAAACDFPTPAATFGFTGTATSADISSGEMTYAIEEVFVAELRTPSRPGVAIEPDTLFPVPGQTIVVDYGKGGGEITTLSVGERYRVKARSYQVPHQGWTSGTLDYFDGPGGCGGNRDASTTYADGSKIQHPLWALARRAQADPRLFAVPVAVLLTIAVVLLIRRGRQRPGVRSANPST